MWQQRRCLVKAASTIFVVLGVAFMVWLSKQLPGSHKDAWLTTFSGTSPGRGQLASACSGERTSVGLESMQVLGRCLVRAAAICVVLGVACTVWLSKQLPYSHKDAWLTTLPNMAAQSAQDLCTGAQQLADLPRSQHTDSTEGLHCLSWPNSSHHKSACHLPVCDRACHLPVRNRVRRTCAQGCQGLGTQTRRGACTASASPTHCSTMLHVTCQCAENLLCRPRGHARTAGPGLYAHACAPRPL